jgi:hypothetical protein
MPSTPAAVYNFDAASGTRKWRLASTDSYARAFQIDADDRGNAYLTGNYSSGIFRLGANALPIVNNTVARLFIAELADPATVSRVLAAPAEHSTAAFALWPNPAHETVQLSAINTCTTATLTDAVGRVVRGTGQSAG